MATFTNCSLQKELADRNKEPLYYVEKVTSPHLTSSTGGFYYALPQNALHITCKVVKTKRVKGPYASYAGKYLEIDNVIIGNTVQYALDNIKLTTSSLPDPDQLYYISPAHPDSLSVPGNMLLFFSPPGALTGSNPPDTEIKKISLPDNETAFDFSAIFKQFAENNLFETIDTIVEKVELDTITIEKTVYKKTMVEKSVEQKAKEAAEYITKLKESKYNLLTGYQEVNYAPATIQFMYDELSSLEQQYIELFTGVIYQSVAYHHYIIVPQPSQENRPIAFCRFSTTDGINDVEINKGELMFVQLQSQKTSSTIQCHQNTLVKNDSAMKNQSGIYYRIPAYCDISIFQGNKMIKEYAAIIAQFGAVAALPNNILKFQLDPDTGALKSVVVNR
ncbi:MAG: DUF4831 family protein [Bacteroidales bacterium]|nr:DUF4831 family protein [Bacteroidales bacterium]